MNARRAFTGTSMGPPGPSSQALSRERSQHRQQISVQIILRVMAAGVRSQDEVAVDQMEPGNHVLGLAA